MAKHTQAIRRQIADELFECVWPQIYLFLCLDVGLLMSYLNYLFFIFSLIFIVRYHITSFKQTYLFSVHFLEYLVLYLDDNVDRNSEKFSISRSSASGCCLGFT